MVGDLGPRKTRRRSGSPTSSSTLAARSSAPRRRHARRPRLARGSAAWSSERSRTPELKDELQRTITEVANSREQLAQHARRMLRLPPAQLFGHESQQAPSAPAAQPDDKPQYGQAQIAQQQTRLGAQATNAVSDGHMGEPRPAGAPRRSNPCRQDVSGRGGPLCARGGPATSRCSPGGAQGRVGTPAP